MKLSVVVAASIVSLLPFISAAPTNRDAMLHKRSEACDLSQLSGVSVTTSAGNGQIRWDLFSTPPGGFDGIQNGQLAWYQNKQPDDTEVFVAVPSTDGSTLFSFQRQLDFQQVVAGSSGFSAQTTGGTEFNVTCTNTCDESAPSTQLAANGCTMELTSGGTGTGQCVSYIGGSSTPVTFAACDGTQSQQVAFFSA